MCKNITFDNLMGIIEGYLEGGKQEQPVIVWFDCPVVLQQLQEGGMAPGVSGFAQWLSEHFANVVFNASPGNPLTNHDYMLSENGRERITDAIRKQNEECIHDAIQSDNDGNLLTKLYIHSPHVFSIGEKGMTSFEYGIMLNSKYSLPNMIFYPVEWKDKISADLSQFAQLTCVDDPA